MTQIEEKEKILISLKKYLLVTIILAVIIRLLIMIATQSWEFEGKGRYGHRAGEIGSAIASGQGYSWPENSSYVPDDAIKRTSWEAPVYPLLFAAVFKMFGIYSNTAAIVLILFQIFLAAIACILVSIIGRRIFNPWIGLLAALIFALYPPGLHYSIQKIQTTYLIAVLLLFFIIQLINAAEAPSVKKIVLTGFTFGIAILTDPTLIAFFPFAIAWLYIKGKNTRKNRIIHITIILLAACVTISPWQIRNYSVFGEFILIKSNFSRELFMGNYGGDYSNDSSKAEEENYMATLNEGQRSRLYSKKALSYIMRDPGRLVYLTLTRFIHYWTATTSKSMHLAETSDIKEQLVGFSYLIMLLFGIAGLVLTRLRGKEVQLLILAIVSLPTPYYLTWFARFRYRFPVESIMIIFASYSAFQLLQLLWRYKASKKLSSII